MDARAAYVLLAARLPTERAVLVITTLSVVCGLKGVVALRRVIAAARKPTVVPVARADRACRILTAKAPAIFTLITPYTSSIKPSLIVTTLSGITTTLSFPTASALPDSSNVLPVIYYSLPATVESTSGTTQTFSQDQITTLSRFNRTSTSTTSWIDDETSTTSTTVVLIVIGPGGFYWSPVPLPTGPKFPIPSLPTPPPLPDPSCFKLASFLIAPYLQHSS
ncbi:hypothetical protein F4824DRAFT_400246 [Ustulina deusta]|nr:hypothetical protein F4824DRAFT_400246 [Ustulina deusta]